MTSVVSEVPVFLVPSDTRIGVAALFGAVQLGPHEHAAFFADTVDPAKLAPTIPDDQTAGKGHKCHKHLEQGRFRLKVSLTRERDQEGKREKRPDYSKTKRIHGGTTGSAQFLLGKVTKL